MRHVRLVARSDEYDPDPGFMISACLPPDGSVPERFMADHGSGMMIAHDVMEHINGFHRMGPVWDELEALGAIWQVRGRHGSLLNSSAHYGNNPHAALANDLILAFEEWDGDNGPHSMHTKPHECDVDFEDIIKRARRVIAEDDADTFLNLALHRMRTGFNKAQRKYGTDWSAACRFERIRDTVRLGRRQIDQEGQEFLLSFDDSQAVIRPLQPFS